MSMQERGCFSTNFSELLMRSPPQAPPSLFKHTVKKCGESNGKVTFHFAFTFSVFVTFILSLSTLSVLFLVLRTREFLSLGGRLCVF